MSTHKFSYILLAFLLAVFSCGCSSREDMDSGSDPVMLSLRVLPVSSRAAGESALKSDVIRELRIVILTADGSRVLFNDQFPVGGDAINVETPLYKVDAGDNLLVYLLANCEGLSLGDGVSLGDNALFTSGRVDNLTFVQDIVAADTYVPMTRRQTISIPPRNLIPEDGKYIYPEPLYVVRAANKLTVTFTNNSDGDIKLRSYSLANINTSGNTFLLPNVSQTSWFEILKENATGSPVPSDISTWIHSYSVPDGVTHQPYSFEPYSLDTGSVILKSKGSDGSVFTDRARLIPESRNPVNTQVGGIQTYQFSVVTDKGTYTTETLNPSYLENLFSLFRNTDIRILVTFDQFGVQIDVQPYQEYAVGVDFGLMRNNLGDLMVLRDSEGNFSEGFYKYTAAYAAIKGNPTLLPVYSSETSSGGSKEQLILEPDDYYAIHVSSDGDIYSPNTELWLMDSDGCRVLTNFSRQDDNSDACNSRLVVYFPTTSPESGVRYRKDREHDIRLQHHSNHSCVVLCMDGMMYFKTYNDDNSISRLHVESWEGNWDPSSCTTTPGVFWVEVKKDDRLCYQKYTEEGIPTEEYVYPE